MDLTHWDFLSPWVLLQNPAASPQCEARAASGGCLTPVMQVAALSFCVESSGLMAEPFLLVFQGNQ